MRLADQRRVPTNATVRPGLAQVTAMPRSVTAPRQVSPSTLQEVRDASTGDEQLSSAFQAATVERPAAHEAPVTRISPANAPPPPQLFALTPTGAPPCGVVEVVAGSPVVSVPPPEDPHPAIARQSAERANRVDAERAE